MAGTVQRRQHAGIFKDNMDDPASLKLYKVNLSFYIKSEHPLTR